MIGHCLCNENFVGLALLSNRKVNKTHHNEESAEKMICIIDRARPYAVIGLKAKAVSSRVYRERYCKKI